MALGNLALADCPVGVGVEVWEDIGIRVPVARGVEGRRQGGGGDEEGESSGSEMHCGKWAALMSEGRDTVIK